MPKVRATPLAAHEQGVRAAVLDAAGALLAEQGLAGLTMSRLAERAGIGRATLYKYFPHVEAVLHAWHDGQARSHLEHLHALAGQDGPPAQRLRRVLAAHAHHRRRASAHTDAADALGALHGSGGPTGL